MQVDARSDLTLRSKMCFGERGRRSIGYIERKGNGDPTRPT